MSSHKPPKELDAIADIVLAYRPKPKSKPAKKRKKLAKKLAASASSKISELPPHRKNSAPY
jgi:hypothetical protein